MDIIVSHTALDFDGLAAMVAANLLHPQAVKVFSGTLSANVKRFMGLYKDLIDISQPTALNHKEVKKMIVVDTANAARLDRLRELVNQPGMHLKVYDHHPPMPDDLRGERNEIHLIGATTTILVEEIIDKGIELSAFDATILALGIYEDTGSLLFSSTTARDLKAAAFLLEKGANLNVVAGFIDQPLSRNQRRLMQELLNGTMRYHIKDYDVVLASCHSNEFVGLVTVTERLLTIENCDAVFVIASQGGKLNIIGRSRTANIPVNEVLETFAGRGHSKAASARIKGQDAGEIIPRLLESLKEKTKSPLVAKDIMSSPVKTVSVYVTMEEAGKTMLRYGHTGMPVVDNNQMVGMISRRDVDKARQHDLGHAPVKGFMTARVITARPDTPVSDIQKAMISHDIGRVPVLDGDANIVGIVSRTDVLRTLHGEDYPEDHTVLYTAVNSREETLLALMQERLPSQLMTILRQIGEVADKAAFQVYLVGGLVRDLLLKVSNFDVDLVVEGDGPEFARLLGEALSARVRVHQRFKTAVLVMADGFKIDIASARAEYYEFPAALPQVQRSSIKEDLYRRDFTINTLAIALNPSRFGDLIDFFGGRRDIEEGIIRILYNLSFVEDPTRIIRAIRFEQRYRFNMEADTLRFARDAIERRMLGHLSYGRILNELIIILNEKDPLSALRRMQEIGVWDYIFPEIDLGRLDWNDMRRINILIGWWQERYQITGVQGWLVYLLYFLSTLAREAALLAVSRYPLSKAAYRSIDESFLAPALSVSYRDNPDIRPSDIDADLKRWTWEGILYLLLCIKDEPTWEKVVHYLDQKERVAVSINGQTLIDLGIAPGPMFAAIFAELYNLKLNGVLKDHRDELEMVKKWLKEDRFWNEYTN
ncbi:MAG: CBS domain-containing protein [Syntrophomonadaceae bacterium]|jgi:tRNA nucleotidyltransferase (CCA-adding enzyme)